MLKNKFQSKLIHPNTWAIESDGCTSYLLVGDKYGLMIDSGFATENIRAYVETLTDKPVEMVANTHGHFDHTGGNGWFSHVYMHEKALLTAKTPYPSLDASKYKTDYPVTTIGDGYYFNLGNREIEVIEIPAHNIGSIAFLDKKERILFTGDEVAERVVLIWMQDEPQPTVEQHFKNMQKLLAHRDEFDFVCSGHTSVMADASLVEDLLENDRRIMAGVEGFPVILPDNLPEDFHMPQIEYKRTSVYKGTELMYDMRYIFEK